MEIGGADTDKCSHRTGYITGRHQLYVIIKPRPSGRGFFSHACACTYLSSFSSFSSAGSASKSVMLFSTRILYQEMSFLMSLS